LESLGDTGRGGLENWVGMVHGMVYASPSSSSPIALDLADVFCRTQRSEGIAQIHTYSIKDVMPATPEDIKRAAESVHYIPGNKVYYKGSKGEFLAEFVRYDNSNEFKCVINPDRKYKEEQSIPSTVIFTVSKKNLRRATPYVA